jgi:hypothetical protein
MSFECRLTEFVILLKYRMKGEHKSANCMPGHATVQQEPELKIAQTSK